MDNKCQVTLWPCEEDMDSRCLQNRPCPSHEPKKHSLKFYPQHTLKMVCPECGNLDGPGGSWLLNGELAYGATGRWPCECGYEIDGKYMRDYQGPDPF